MSFLKNNFLLLLFIFFCIFLSPLRVHAQVKLPALFSDGTVLQQKSNASFWGWSAKNASVRITTSWDKKDYKVKADRNGKWQTKLTTPSAGGPFTISVSDSKSVTIKDVYTGEVWLCSGQSNMEMPMKGFKDQPLTGSNDEIFNSENKMLHLYTVPRAVERQVMDTSKTSSWKTANPETVSNFSATAYYFGKMLQQRLKVHVALINDSYGGSPAEAFMSEASLKQFPEISIPAANGAEKLTNKFATVLYNGMIHPIIGYTIKGAIWYQGETNYDRPDQYETLFPAMVSLWRKEWAQGDFPFYYAQIAPFKYSSLPDQGGNEKLNSAYLRDAQRKALNKIPRSGMVVLVDAGEEKTIHPPNKEIVGKRFAYLALGDTYGEKGFGYQSPSFEKMTIKDSIATIEFSHAPNGLTSFLEPLTQFEIAGADKKFYPANASVNRGAVQVSSPEVPNPVAVRYAFKDYVNGQLFSTEGFPVSSFRTDDW